MVNDSINLEPLVNGLSNIVGLERAQEIVCDARKAHQIADQQAYSRQEVRQIADFIKQQGGMIAIIASATIVRMLST